MSRPSTDQLEAKTVADVMHADVATMAPSTTVGEARAWFEASASRRLAVVARRGRYLGSLTAADVAHADAGGPVRDLARVGPTVAPDAPAHVGLRLVLAEDARRVAVVDADGLMCGVLAVTTDARHFACRDG